MNDVDKLEIICQKLGTEATYVVVHNATDLQQGMFKVLHFRFK